MHTLQLLAASSIDLGPALTQIGIGALIAVPAYGLSWRLWQAREKTLVECAQLREDQVMRERQLNDTQVPLFTETARLLKAAADAGPTTNEIERMMRRMEENVDRMARERGR